MKKIRYFLVLLIISFFVISNFSIAWEGNIYCDKDTSACSTRDISPCCPAEGVSSFICTNEGDITVYRIKLNGNIMSREIITCPTTYNVDTRNYKLLAYGGAGITQGYHVGETDVMPVSALTPAIDGLNGVVVELIPYVIFIGIGMLIATLGFYAIRRLVNWIGGKVNSNFKSKS